MESSSIDHLKFPIGNFVPKDQYTHQELAQNRESIGLAPEQYREAVQNLTEGDLEKTYRPGSWTVKQLVHHVADIQLLHYLRMKKALTESDYKEVTLINMDGWATTPDANEAPVIDSLDMLDSITRRYVLLLRSLGDQELTIQYYHPVRRYTINQAQAIAMSAWHLQHHLAHIRIALTST
ncbi:MAG TPA: putative metal-dependent hydrolase [Flavisolibacter sp.]|jgi:hypothetical protein|nr:putative metal-dependent hydrolase [Flavisolibacter sp.]